jgi:hypothetical protein
MKKYLLLITWLINSFAYGQQFKWVQTIPVQGVSSIDEIYSYDEDFLIAGSYNNPSSGSDFQGYFFARVDSMGTIKWLKKINSSQANIFRPSITHGADIIAFASGLSGTAIIDGVSISSSSLDVLLLAFSADNGAVQFTSIYGESSSMENSESIVCDSAGNIYMIGRYHESFNLDGHLLPAYNESPFIVKYDKHGSAIWVKAINSNSIFSDGKIAINLKNDKIAVQGAFGDSISFDGLGFKTQGYWDMFIYELNTSGVVRWGTAFGSVGQEISRNISYTYEDYLLSSGQLDGAVSFDNSTLVVPNQAGALYIAIYDSTSTCLYADVKYVDKPTADLNCFTGVYGSKIFKNDYTGNQVWGKQINNVIFNTFKRNSSEYLVAGGFNNSADFDGIILNGNSWTNFFGVLSNPGPNYVDKINATSDVKIFPNPTRDKVYISISPEIFKDVIIVNVYDAKFNLQNMRPFNYVNKTIEMSMPMASGVYFIEILTNNRRYLQKVIKE